MAETIAMTGIDRDRAFWSQILLANACQNFMFQWWQSLSGRARNSQCREILPVVVLWQITLIQDNNFVRIGGRPVKLRKLSRVEMRRLRHVAISDVQAQISQLQRFLCARDCFNLQ